MKKTLIIVLASAIVIGVVLFFIPKQNQGEKIVLAWSGISAVPTWAKDISVETSGNSFTREFTMMFSGTTAEVEQWVAENSVFKTAEKKVGGKVDSNGEEVYILVPQEGASYAEVTINAVAGTVKIRVYWS